MLVATEPWSKDRECREFHPRLFGKADLPRAGEQEVQERTPDSVKIALVDRGYTGDQPKEDVLESGIELQVVKLPLGRERIRASAEKMSTLEKTLLPRKADSEES